MKFILSILIIATVFNFSIGQKKIILDTDPSADPDDVGCMAMLHNMATNGECEILAIINSTHFKQSSLSISAINEFYNRKAIPVGDYKGYKTKVEAPESNYDYHLARAYPRNLKSWKESLNGVTLYREILASAEDVSITIVIIGTMHNFHDLLKSKGDKFSSLNGIQLVKKKVAQVVTMGGNFIDGKGYDRTNWGGADQLCEYTNWSCLNEERNSMCRFVINQCPSPFIASGWEVGCGDYYNANYGNVITGQGLRDLDTTHILRRSYEYHFLTRGETKEISRHSNDQCALHYAVRGERNNYTAFSDGKITLDKSGVCTWEKTPKGNQGFIQKKRDKNEIADEIEFLMMMKKPEVDITPPFPPTQLSFDKIKKRVTWTKSDDRSKGSWVVAYNVYAEDNFIATVFGNQLFLNDQIKMGMRLEIKAINSSGVESEPSQITIQ